MNKDRRMTASSSSPRRNKPANINRQLAAAAGQQAN
jgi:hypothetical protein